MGRLVGRRRHFGAEDVGVNRAGGGQVGHGDGDVIEASDHGWRVAGKDGGVQGEENAREMLRQAEPGKRRVGARHDMRNHLGND